MMYLVTSGDYSNYGVDALLSRDTEPDEAEIARIRAAYAQAEVDSAAALEAWYGTDGSKPAPAPVRDLGHGSFYAVALVRDFGFVRVPYRTIHDGTVDVAGLPRTPA